MSVGEINRYNNEIQKLQIERLIDVVCRDGECNDEIQKLVNLVCNDDEYGLYLNTRRNELCFIRICQCEDADRIVSMYFEVRNNITARRFIKVVDVDFPKINLDHLYEYGENAKFFFEAYDGELVDVFINVIHSDSDSE